MPKLNPGRPALPANVAKALVVVKMWCEENGYVVKIFRKIAK